MRYDIIELFTDIDDDFIAGAMPEAQRAVELKADTRRFSWKKFAAAAACLAVIVIGGVLAVNMVRSGNGRLVASDPTSNPNPVNSVDSDPTYSAASEPTSSVNSEPTSSTVSEPINSDIPKPTIAEYPESAKYQYTGDFSELELYAYAMTDRIVYQSFDELVENSDLVVVGTFVDDARQDRPTDWWTEQSSNGASFNKLRIDKVFCGDVEVGSEIVISDSYFVTKGKLMYIFDSTLTPMIKGEQWVYFLRKQSPEHGNYYQPISTEGRYPVPGKDNTFVLTDSQYGVVDGGGFYEDIYEDVKKMLGYVDGVEEIGDILSVDYNTQYIRTNGYIAEEEYPKTLWITNTTELSNYYQSNKEKYGLGSVKNPLADQTIGFIDAIEKYNDTFFETNDLILIVLEEGSGSIRHSVKEVSVTPSGLNHIEYCIQPTIERIVPENGTCDMAEWHIIIEISKEYGSTKCQLKQPLIMNKPEFNDNTSTQIEKIECEDWTATKEFTMPEFPGDTFVWKKDEMLVSHSGETASMLYGAPGIVSVYLADLNGDGKRELVNLCRKDPGLTANELMVYDYANSKLYTIKSDTMLSYELEIRGNELYVVTRILGDYKVISSEPLTFDMLEPITRCGLDNLNNSNNSD